MAKLPELAFLAGSTTSEPAPYYRDDLARIHELGYGFHAERCAPGILAALAPVRERGGLVLELGCGGGHLTRRLVAAGYRVLATDASPSMLEIARVEVPQAEGLERVVLPDDPLPPADAVVSVGHVLNYLPDEASIHRALVAAARALRPGGLFAVDLQDLSWGVAYRDAPSHGRVEKEWALVSEFSLPEPRLFVRSHVSFLPNPDGSWRRDEEVHRNVLLDTAELPARLAEHGLHVRVGASFGDEELPEGLVTLMGHKEG
ncbi:MAG: class I SAM-dependent methyltransferase [Myxococcota bacterium]|nr:class I SAM-dependent methyltransferase [Myxococcota bacterium]